MLIKQSQDIASSEITPESIYLARRDFMRGSLAFAAAGASLTSLGALAEPTNKELPLGDPKWLADKIKIAQPNSQIISENLTPYANVTTHNNFYEFGYDKTDPAKNSANFKPSPWTVEVTGQCAKNGVFTLEDLIKGIDLEERVYRLRCVEAWSMVIPWIGFPLASLLKRFEPMSSAKYVSFITLKDSEQFPAQKSVLSTIDWPYREALRIDEAMHPLTIMAVGLYGKVLPNQNGAPLRLVVPWKYGFKSIKSIVKIEFTEKRPKTTWSQLAPDEYGFYANVNPNVDHPRWSQATERRLPSGLFSPNRIPTKMFNGYADQVADLYKGMDLKRNY